MVLSTGKSSRIFYFLTKNVSFRFAVGIGVLEKQKYFQFIYLSYNFIDFINEALLLRKLYIGLAKVIILKFLSTITALAEI